jgi:hypothetical protein
VPYNPFDKPIGDKLSADDLQMLVEREVAEGYFVEYKREFLANKTIGLSIASFANTYGGWFIVGVEADNHIASKVRGFNLATYPEPVAKVREIAKTHIDPVPIFFPQVVKLQDDKAVLVVYISGDQETPFISKDGRVYRRTYDSSNPIPEKDRYAIDRLVDAGRDQAKQFEIFCRDERTFSAAEEGQGWVKLFISPYPLDPIEKRLDLVSSEGVERLILLSQSPVKLRVAEAGQSWNLGTGNIPFNSGQTTGRSVILRYVEPSEVDLNSLTTELFIDGRAKFFIPLFHVPVAREENIDEFKSSQVKQALSRNWATDQEYKTQLLRFFDMGRLWSIVAILLSFYQEWLGEDHCVTDFKVAVLVEDVWRTVPFLDLDEWGVHVQKCGLPVVSSDIRKFPSDTDRPLLISVDEERTLWPAVCSLIGLVFGLPIELNWSLAFNAIASRQEDILQAEQ